MDRAHRFRTAWIGTGLALTAAASPGVAPGRGAGFAPGRDLVVARGDGRIEFVDALDGSVQPFGQLAVAAQALTVGSQFAWVSLPGGELQRADLAGGPFRSWLQASNDAVVLVDSPIPGLVAGGSDGSLIVYAYESSIVKNLGNQVGAVTAVETHALHVISGSASGAIFDTEFTAGDPPKLVAQCAGAITALCVRVDLDGSEPSDLYAADDTGRVWRFDPTDYRLLGTWSLPAPAVSLAILQGDLLARSASGLLWRCERKSGLLKQTLDLGPDALALAISPSADFNPQLFGAFCFGSPCPCANDDAEHACGNSTGFGANGVAQGTASVSADDLAFAAYDLPAHSIGRFVMGNVGLPHPFAAGLLCVQNGPQIGLFRFPPAATGNPGTLTLGPGLVGLARALSGNPNLVQAGQTIAFQAWYRDPGGPCGQTANTSLAWALTFQP